MTRIATVAISAPAGSPNQTWTAVQSLSTATVTVNTDNLAASVAALMVNESSVFSPWKPPALTGPRNAGTNAALITFTPTITATFNLTLQVPYGGPNGDGGAPPLPSSTAFNSDDGTLLAVRDAVTDIRNSLALQRCVYGGQRNSSQWWTFPSVTNRDRCIMVLPPAAGVTSPPRLVLADNTSDSRCDWQLQASGSNGTYVLTNGQSCAALRNSSEPYLIAGSCQDTQALQFEWDGHTSLARLPAAGNNSSQCLASVEPNVLIRAAVLVKAITGATAPVSLISRQDYNVTVALSVTKGVPVQLLVLVPVHDCGSTAASVQACKPGTVATGIAGQIKAAADFDRLQGLQADKWASYWGQMQVGVCRFCRSCTWC